MMDDGPSGFAVFVNEGGQYGIHPADADEPDGWREAGFVGTEQECMKFVDDNWSGFASDTPIGV